MIESSEIIEPPDDIEPVSREEAQGMWRQLDFARLGMHGLMARMSAVERDMSNLLGSMRVVKVLLGIPCLLATAVLLRVLWLLSSHDARALLSMVSP